MDIARFNFGYGNREGQKARIDRVKKVRRDMGAPTALMADVSGPEIRTGALVGGDPIKLQAGKHIVLTEDKVEGTARRVQQTQKGLAQAVEPGTPILIDAGTVELAVDEVQGTDILCTVQNTGTLYERQTISLPETQVDQPALTAKDEDDLVFAIEQDVDFAAVLVRSADDVRTVRAFLESHGGAHVGLVAKIGSSEAVDAIDQIIELSDAVMLTRGALGAVMDASKIPHIQKRIIRLCNEKHTPVITADQLLDSMTRNPRPTRAEATDVANAVCDGSDCLMLSNETAVGKYPVPALRMMAKIAEANEDYVPREGEGNVTYDCDAARVAPMVGRAAVRTAEEVHARCIVTPTNSGRTARLISNLRPSMPIYAVTQRERVMRRMQILWGVTPMLAPVEDADMKGTLQLAQDAVRTRGLVAPGDLAVFTAGDSASSPLMPAEGASGAESVPTNVMYVVQIRANATEKEGE